MRRIERRLSALVDRRLQALRRLIEPVRVRLERPPGERLVGLRWRRRRESVEVEQWRRGVVQFGVVCVTRPEGLPALVERDRFDLWVCLVPFFPLHVSWTGPRRQRVPAWASLFKPQVQGLTNAEGEAEPPAEKLAALTPAMAN